MSVARAAACSRSRWRSRKAKRLRCSRSPSQMPSPTRNPLSKTEILASERWWSSPLMEILMSALRGSSTAAWVLACAGDDHPATDAERLTDRLAPLPLTALPLEDEVLDDLQALGITRLGECLRLPRASLKRRFSEALMGVLDRARGLQPDPRRPWMAPRIFRRR